MICPWCHGIAVRISVSGVVLKLILGAVQEQSQKRPLILISGFIHDVSTFIEEHPGGAHLIVKFIG